MTRVVVTGAVLACVAGPAAVTATGVDTARGQDQLGSIDFHVTGSAEARAHFLRGVLAMHSFWYDEALAEFRTVTAAEPGFAMGYWGEAMALNHPVWQEQDTEAGRKAIAKLPQRALSAITSPERDLLAAVQVLYGVAVPAGEVQRRDKHARDLAYADAMAALYKKNPTDEVACFYALALLGSVAPQDSGVRQRMHAGALGLGVLARNPQHPGAAHYVIHAFDDPDHAVLALPAAHSYAAIAPAAAHARHMPSHIFVQLGMWPEAAVANQSSSAAALADARRKGIAPQGDYYHAQSWLAAIELERGRRPQALSALQELGGHAGQGRDMFAWVNYANVTLAYLLDTGEWQRAGALLAPFKDLPQEPAAQEVAGPACGAHKDVSVRGKPSGTRPYALLGRATVAAIRGLAAVAQRDRGAARAAADEIHGLRGQVADAQGGTVEKSMALLEYRVAAAASWLPGEADPAAATRAIDEARKAVAVEDQLPPPSGPAFGLSSYELLGDLLSRAGRAEEAAAAYDTALQRHPGRAHSLVGARTPFEIAKDGR